MFKERKAAQIAAYFLNKDGGAMPHIKLVKLMYLADRQAYDDYGFSISEDDAVSMPYGPVLSKTLDLINGNVRYADAWKALISAKADNKVALCNTTVDVEDLDELVTEEMSVFDKVFDKFGGFDKWKLVDYTHTLPEWKDPGKSVIPIHPREILEALGKTDEEIEAGVRLADEMNTPTSLSDCCNLTFDVPLDTKIYAEKLNAILSH